MIIVTKKEINCFLVGKTFLVSNQESRRCRVLYLKFKLDNGNFGTTNQITDLDGILYTIKLLKLEKEKNPEKTIELHLGNSEQTQEIKNKHIKSIEVIFD
jgi:hypothetical protein